MLPFATIPFGSRSIGSASSARRLLGTEETIHLSRQIVGLLGKADPLAQFTRTPPLVRCS